MTFHPRGRCKFTGQIDTKYAKRRRESARALWLPRLATIREQLAAGISSAEIGRRYGVTGTHVRKVLRKYSQKD